MVVYWAYFISLLSLLRLVAMVTWGIVDITAAIPIGIGVAQTPIIIEISEAVALVVLVFVAVVPEAGNSRWWMSENPGIDNPWRLSMRLLSLAYARSFMSF